MALNLAGKAFMVSGATRGLGRALTVALSKQGCKVYALGRNKDLLKSLDNECSNVKTIEVDVSKWREVREKLKDVEVLDGLVNNAALVGQGFDSALDISEEQLNKNFALNVNGTINITQIVSKKMIENGRPGSIVNVSSIWAIQACPGCLPYGVSKAAVYMVTKQFALELGPHRIRVNSVNPTLFLSDTIKDVIKREADGFVDLFRKKTPIPKIAEVEEMVPPILYLLSDMSTMVSGTSHVIDGAMIPSFVTKF